MDLLHGPDLARDLGIGLLVSFVVASLFEFYRNKRHEIESMKDVLDIVMGSKLTPEVWTEVVRQLESKRVIREDVDLRLELKRDPGLPAHEAILSVEHSYKLSALGNKKVKEYQIRHELDYQFSRQSLNLPRWEAGYVDPSSAILRGSKINLKKPVLEFQVSLEARQNNEPLYVETRRVEIVTLPGSYNFYVPEFMMGFRLRVIGCPGFRTEVIVRPYGSAEALSPAGDNSWKFDELIFPGQGIEVKFLQMRLLGSPTATDALEDEGDIDPALTE